MTRQNHFCLAPRNPSIAQLPTRSKRPLREPVRSTKLAVCTSHELVTVPCKTTFALCACTIILNQGKWMLLVPRLPFQGMASNTSSAPLNLVSSSNLTEQLKYYGHFYNQAVGKTPVVRHHTNLSLTNTCSICRRDYSKRQGMQAVGLFMWLYHTQVYSSRDH